MRTVIYCCIALLLFSCKESSKEITSEEVTDIVAEDKAPEPLKSLAWLLGDWHNTSEGITSYERWIRESDTVYNASSVSIRKSDTVFSEAIKLHVANDSIYMSVTGAQEDKQQSVTFTLVSTKDQIFTFENKQHDFPQQIVYSNPSKDSLHAWIIGMQGEQKIKSDFYFERVND